MLQENLPKNTEILTVSAEDADKNRTITYNLEAGGFDSLKMLDINPKTGTVFILEKLDFEDQKWLNFTIRATDNGVPSRLVCPKFFFCKQLSLAAKELRKRP